MSRGAGRFNTVKNSAFGNLSNHNREMQESRRRNILPRYCWIDCKSFVNSSHPYYKRYNFTHFINSKRRCEFNEAVEG
jgi:hypothetical protein